MKYYVSIITLMIFLSATISSHAQSQQWLFGVESYWSDTFVEWRVYTDDEDVEGRLAVRWEGQNDFTEWDYDINGETGSIVQRFSNKTNEWELRTGEELISIRPRWVNDLTEWKITTRSSSYIFKSKWRNNFNEWQLTNNTKEKFSIKTNWDNDPRQWEIYDETTVDFSFGAKMAMVFITTYYSTPK